VRGDPEAELHVPMKLSHADFGVQRLATAACLLA